MPLIQSSSPSFGHPNDDKNVIEEGLDFILSHFQQPIFPRTISTKTTENKQVTVYNKEETLARFKAAKLLDCKISAYPKYIGYKGINRQAPNLIFISSIIHQKWS